MRYSRFEDLPVWKSGARLFVRIDKLCADSELCKRGDIADQLHRAALSITNNIAEGFEQGTNQQLITYLYYARGSAGEVRSMLQQMLAIPRLGHLKAEALALRVEAEAVSKQLRGFADSLQNSGIEGQRYLTDAARDQQERRASRAAFESRIADVMARAREKWDSGVGQAEPNLPADAGPHTAEAKSAV
jgi:four helix bundle protein